MTKLYLTGAIALISLAASAQQNEYKPILQDGKRWILKVTKYEDPDFLRYDEVCVAGDTVVDGLDARIVVRQVHPTGIKLSYVLREEDKQLWYLCPDNQFWYPLLNFNLDIGENTVDAYDMWLTTPWEGVITVTDKGEMNFGNFTTTYLKYLNANYDLEGIGAPDGNFLTHLYFGVNGKPKWKIWECYLNEERIFTWDAFEAISAVTSPEAISPDRSELYDMLGRQVKNPGPGWYIKDGKKILIR